MSHLYSIQLLQDLHDHFPDVLYRPDRFRNVSDLLQYVIRVANQSPYRRGRQQFMNTHPFAGDVTSVRSPPSFMPFPSSTAPVSFSAMASATSASPAASSAMHSAPSAPSAPSVLSHMVFDILASDGTNAPSAMDPQLINFLGSLFQNMDAPIGVPLETTSPLTPDMIDRSTQLQSAQQTQEDQCAICQDHMTEGQSLRTILHCRHLFHQTCIDVWFQTHATCPTCRYRIGSD